MGKSDINDKQKIFRDAIGQKATVRREQVGADQAAGPNRALCDLGLSIQRDPQYKLETYEYLGSAAVHIYANKTLGLLDIVSQANPLVLYRCPEDVAAKGIEDLIREVKAAFGRTHGKLRSGF